MHHPSWAHNRGTIAFSASRGTSGKAANQVNLVKWPAAPFARSIMVTVPLVEHIDAAWTNAAGADSVGPFVANNPNTEQLRARFLCPVPQLYVALCINRMYTPHGFWTNVIGQIRQDQLTQDCNILVNWATSECAHIRYVGKNVISTKFICKAIGTVNSTRVTWKSDRSQFNVTFCIKI
jgi:hypothetical protein